MFANMHKGNGSGIYSGVIRDSYSKALPTEVAEYKRNHIINVMKEKNLLGDRDEFLKGKEENERIRNAQKADEEKRKIIADKLKEEAGKIERGEPVEVNVNVDTGAIPKIVTDTEKQKVVNEKRKEAEREKEVVESAYEKPKEEFRILPSMSGKKPEPEPIIIKNSQEQPQKIIVETPQEQDQEPQVVDTESKGEDDDFESKLLLASAGVDVS